MNLSIGTQRGTTRTFHHGLRVQSMQQDLGQTTEKRLKRISQMKMSQSIYIQKENVKLSLC